MYNLHFILTDTIQQSKVTRCMLSTVISETTKWCPVD